MNLKEKMTIASEDIIDEFNIGKMIYVQEAIAIAEKYAIEVCKLQREIDFKWMISEYNKAKEVWNEEFQNTPLVTDMLE